MWMNYSLTISKTLEYPMQTSTLTKQEWESLVVPLNKAALPKSGLVRSFPHAVLYGPLKYQGMGAMHHWYNQELTHLAKFVEHVHKEDSCGL